MISRVLLAIVTFGGINLVYHVDPATLRGSWAYDGRTCKAIDAKLVAKMKTYQCIEPTGEQRTATASHKPLKASCSTKKHPDAYLVFESQADCIEEKETQSANGE